MSSWPGRPRTRTADAVQRSDRLGETGPYASAGLSASRAEENFTGLLNRHLRKSGLSLTQLARRSWLDISYVSRLVNIECDPLNPRLDDHPARRQPSRDAVIRLGLALQLPIEDLDELLMAANYAPLVR